MSHVYDSTVVFSCLPPRNNSPYKKLHLMYTFVVGGDGVYKEFFKTKRNWHLIILIIAEDS